MLDISKIKRMFWEHIEIIPVKLPNTQRQLSACIAGPKAEKNSRRVAKYFMNTDQIRWNDAVDYRVKVTHYIIFRGKTFILHESINPDKPKGNFFTISDTLSGCRVSGGPTITHAFMHLSDIAERLTKGDCIKQIEKYELTQPLSSLLVIYLDPK